MMRYRISHREFSFNLASFPVDTFFTMFFYYDPFASVFKHVYGLLRFVIVLFHFLCYFKVLIFHTLPQLRGGGGRVLQLFSVYSSYRFTSMVFLFNFPIHCEMRKPKRQQTFRHTSAPVPFCEAVYVILPD